jgi:hypothetical protein
MSNRQAEKLPAILILAKPILRLVCHSEPSGFALDRLRREISGVFDDLEIPGQARDGT